MKYKYSRLRIAEELQDYQLNPNGTETLPEIMNMLLAKEESKPVEEHGQTYYKEITCDQCLFPDHKGLHDKTIGCREYVKPVELPEIDKITLGIKDIHFGAFITFGDKINEIIDRLNILTKGR